MKHLKIIFSSMMAATALCSSAAPRTQGQMQQAAARVLQAHRAGQKAAPAGSACQRIAATSTYAVYTIGEGGFAIISADDLLPEVLAYSSGSSSSEAGKHLSPSSFSPETTSNTGLRWWLEAIDEAASAIVKSGVRRAPIKPNTDIFPGRVEPMVTCTWGQEEPYWNACPWGSSGYESGRCLTGCVATAIAQIMYYHKFPEHGQSYHHIYYPSGDVSGLKLEVDYSESYYDWDNMIDSYQEGYTETQAKAVAKLMYDCGVASNMIYRPTASGALTVDAAEGLVKYFGYAETTKKEDRDNYTDENWMNKVFQELSQGRPFFYGANDVGAGGHAFVIDGYNEDGLVHVNWGWEGKENGFYDISILNPKQYQFSMNQDAIMGIEPDHVIETIKDDLTLAAAGDLATHYNAEEQMRVKQLKLAGPLNSSDIRALRRMAGVDENGKATTGILKNLDLSETTIVAGGEPYLADGSLTTEDDAIGTLMFAGCTALQSLQLPPSIKRIGDGAFIDCTSLHELTIPEGDDKEYRLMGNIIMSPDMTEVIGTLPYDQTAYYELPNSVTRIHDYAFYKMVKLVNMVLPSTVTHIGQHSYEGCASLRQLKLFAQEPPTLGTDCFADVSKRACTILVRTGSKAKYEAADGWSEFKGTYMNDTHPVNFDNIKEFGTTVKVTNAYREYGESNPSKYGYKVSGDKLSGGTPELTCDADEFSPVGEYPIHISAGTITDEAVDYVDGTLFVLPALLTVTANDAERPAYSNDPVFTLTYEGWRNDEDESVLEELPVVTTTATWQSPAGTYPLTVSGGIATNYEMEYIDGTLTITDAPIPSGIADHATWSQQTEQGIYNLQGVQVQKPRHGVYILNRKKIIK